MNEMQLGLTRGMPVIINDVDNPEARLVAVLTRYDDREATWHAVYLSTYPQRMRCAALAQLGMIAEAGKFLEQVRIGQPQLTLQWIRESVPYQTSELMDHFLDGMRKAGVQEN